MRIAVDLRNLQSGFLSGVENYTINVLERLLKKDQQNHYTLFYNAFRPTTAESLRFVNSNTVTRRFPNKLLNLSLRAIGRPYFEKYIGDFDILFLPNFNQFAIGKTKKLAITVHDLSPFVLPEFYNTKRRIWHASLPARKTLARADVIFAVSEFTKLELIKLFNVAPEKIVVTHLGVDHSLFQPNIPEARLREVRNVYGLPGEFLLYFGTIEPRKNVVGLIQAYNAMQTNIDLVIAGRPGWKYSEVFREIEKSPKKRNIHVLGFVEEADPPALLKLAKAFVFPSFYEGFGLPVLEAMSVGTPVVTSQVTSIPEVTGDTALLVDPYNVPSIAKALDVIVTDAALRESFSKKGIAHAQQFTWDKTAEKVLESFNRIFST